MKFPFDRLSGTSEICGHARGLVCLTHLQTVPEICNPSTGQSFTLPKLDKRRVRVRSFFVYDQISEQFKVLSITWPSCNDDWRSAEHQVLTLGTPSLSWRMIECSTPHLPLSNRICINGCLYYNAKVDPLSSGTSTIVCFDVRSEIFRIIRRPSRLQLWDESVLVNYNGKLGVGPPQVTGESRCIELWVLIDAEKPEWTKHTYAFPPLWKNLVHDEAMLYDVGMTSTNEFLLAPRCLSDHFYVFYYNFERHTILRVEIQGMYGDHHSRVRTYLHHVEDVKLYVSSQDFVT